MSVLKCPLVTFSPPLSHDPAAQDTQMRLDAETIPCRTTPCFWLPLNFPELYNDVETNAIGILGSVDVEGLDPD